MARRRCTVDEMRLVRRIVTECTLFPASLKRTGLRCRGCGYTVILSLTGVGIDVMLEHLGSCDKEQMNPGRYNH